MPAKALAILLPLLTISCSAVHAEAEPIHAETPMRTTLHATTVSVPMLSWGGRPVVEARVNGKGPFKLILDTGTSFPLVLDDALVNTLELPVTATTRPRDEAEELDVVDVDTLAIGEAEFSSIQGIRSSRAGCASMIGEGIQGILGLPLFKDCLLTLDFPKRRVRLESGGLPEPDGETIEYSADKEDDYGVTLTLSVGGVPVKTHIDTGSPALVTFLNKFQKKLPLKGKPHVVGVARTPQGEAEVRSAVLDGIIKLGKHEWVNPRIDFADLGPMLDYDAGNIGSRLLKDFAVTVDQKNHRVRFRRGESVRD
ncbi:MAG: retropepsin-like domain-containing protein [Phycisphaerales bacterium]|nr:MAG: retropepsin-like domain-containing protein [Phycisphaerales bacterium]